MGGNTTISTIEPVAGSLRVQTAVYGSVVPLVYGRTRISGNLIWFGGFTAIPHTSSQSSGGKGGGGVTQQSTTYTYTAAVAMALGEGLISGIITAWKDKAKFTSLSSLGLSIATGAIGQAVWGYLTTNYPAQALGYSGLAYLYAPAYDLGSNAQVPNHSFEVSTPWEQVFSVDADPGAVIVDMLSNSRYGADFPVSKLGSVTNLSTYARAQGLLISPAMTSQKPAAEWLQYVLSMCNSDCTWSQGVVKFVPLGDVSITGNGITYTPSVSPVYDLTEDNFLVTSPTEDAVQVTRKSNEEAYNHIRVEYCNRNNEYNLEIVEAKDAADIDQRGIRTAATLEAHAICDTTAAQALATLALGRQMAVRNTYKFTLPWTFGLVEPLDLLTITYAPKGLVRTPVRVNKIDELDNGSFTFEAEDAPIGMATAPTYGAQAGTGFSHNYNVTPGSVTTPMFFEAPVERTVTGLEVYMAIRSASATWGGCRVWTSTDGTNYKNTGIIYGPARFGTITGPISGGVLPVVLGGGQMISGSATDAASLTTLCYIGGANPEYLAYTTATLTGANAYNLSGLNRSAFTTSGAAHTNGDAFARVDDAIAKSGPLDLSMIGKTIYFKFTSFNTYNAAEELLSAVTAYTYTITGALAKLPPAAVTGMATTVESFGIRISCNRNLEPDVDHYEYRVGAAWATATVLEPAGGTSYLWRVQVVGSPVVWIAAVDVFGNYSTPISLTVVVAAPASPALTYAVAGTNEIISWGIPTSGFAVDRYEIRYGASWAAGTFIDTTKATGYTRKVDYAGARTYWVAAIDAAGNVGVAGSIGVNITAPGVVTSIRADVIDNNALIYWNAPASGTLPVDRYEVRKGASWAAGTLIGSNGNSTFAAVFEQTAGTYSYWVAAIDSAGTVGTAVSVSAVISQPPDYVLRANINSTLNGTLTNGVASAGILLFPVNTAETWTQHFVNNGYASPQAQITAGSPLYLNPSLTTGSYVEGVDYGSVLASTNITATLNSTVISGTVGISCQIQYKLLAGDPWTNAVAGATTAVANNFRYVRVTYTFTATAGANLLQINGLNIKLAVKQRNDSGSGTASVGGTAVSFGYPFLSADTPLVQPNGTTPLIPVVIYAGGVNPTGFTVKLYNTSGTDVGGAFSWTVRGY
jgi:hypothetical protein